jgi:hypothetical protein
MPEKLIYVKPIELRDEISKKVWVKEFGNYNTSPLPVEQISNKKFADIASRGTPDYMEYRVIKSDGVYIPAYIYWYDDNGLMILFPREGDISMTYWLVGCYHELVELSIQECEVQGIKHSGAGCHIFKCSKCGYIDIVYDEVSTDAT